MILSPEMFESFRHVWYKSFIFDQKYALKCYHRTVDVPTVRTQLVPDLVRPFFSSWGNFNENFSDNFLEKILVSS